MDSGESNGEPSADLFKATAALILFSIALVGGLLPQRLQNVGKKVVSCLNMAAGGVFFASAMVHMLPESSETLNDAWGDVFPWGGYFCAFGFLLILCIDQAVSISHARRRKGRKGGHSLVPTEPPSVDDLNRFGQRRGINGGSHRNTDSEDLAELEMAAISPKALLGSSAMGDSHEAVVRGGGTNGDRNGNGGEAGGASGSKGGGGAGSNGGGACPQQGLISSPSSTDSHGDEDCADHHHHGGHAHAHGLGGEGDGVWVRLALLLALSVHSVMEGLGVGAKTTKAYNLLFAIGVHKGLAAYALGASLLQSGVYGKQVTLFVIAFSAMTPLGILLGALIEKDGEDDSGGAVCVALAAGTFLYVSLMEVLPPELASTENGWSKMGSLVLGFVVSAGVGWLVG
ncbi:conserved unknown protein [Ectocarpus siliculosus]|uniref:Uncharacterized protein n=1 Tax=Ectocarpus siliculosus TaxID=2880 RepID=D7FLN8_ECTSI|nr:conserved unknown protein [Ectocarpus siliculosus]|eukprot:CBJ25854.1 conserved unknown protein [Ectocarpus siliculosus]